MSVVVVMMVMVMVTVVTLMFSVFHTGGFIGRVRTVVTIDTFPIGRLTNLVRDVDVRWLVFVGIHENVSFVDVDLISFIISLLFGDAVLHADWVAFVADEFLRFFLLVKLWHDIVELGEFVLREDKLQRLADADERQNHQREQD